MLFSSEKQVIVKSTPVIILLSAFDLQFYLIFVYHSGVEEAEALMSARRSDALCKTKSSKTRPVIPGESLHSAFSGEEERVDHTLSIQTMIDCPNITTSPPPNLSK